MVIAYGFPLTTLDPQKHYNAVHESVLRNVYEPLIALSADLQTMEPVLATSFRRVNDLTTQFKLRQGVKFHNREEFDASAVKFTVDRIFNPETKVPLLNLPDDRSPGGDRQVHGELCHQETRSGVHAAGQQPPHEHHPPEVLRDGVGRRAGPEARGDGPVPVRELGAGR